MFTKLEKDLILSGLRTQLAYTESMIKKYERYLSATGEWDDARNKKYYIAVEKKVNLKETIDKVEGIKIEEEYE